MGIDLGLDDTADYADSEEDFQQLINWKLEQDPDEPGQVKTIFFASDSANNNITQNDIHRAASYALARLRYSISETTHGAQTISGFSAQVEKDPSSDNCSYTIKLAMVTDMPTEDIPTLMTCGDLRRANDGAVEHISQRLSASSA